MPDPSIASLAETLADTANAGVPVPSAELEPHWASAVETWQHHHEGQPDTLQRLADPVLRFAVRFSAQLPLDSPTVSTMITQAAEMMADAADDADQPSQAYSWALRLRPADPELLAALVECVGDAQYACEGAFSDVATADPERATMWRGLDALATFQALLSYETRDDALEKWLRTLGYARDLTIDSVREIASELRSTVPSAASWTFPTDDEWTLLAELSS